MKLFGCLVLASLLLAATGCVAVSAKDINTGPRYQAVAGDDNNIFIVDTQKSVAWRAQMVVPPPPADDCPDEQQAGR